MTCTELLQEWWKAELGKPAPLFMENTNPASSFRAGFRAASVKKDVLLADLRRFLSDSRCQNMHQIRTGCDDCYPDCPACAWFRARAELFKRIDAEDE